MPAERRGARAPSRKRGQPAYTQRRMLWQGARRAARLTGRPGRRRTPLWRRAARSRRWCPAVSSWSGTRPAACRSWARCAACRPAPARCGPRRRPLAAPLLVRRAGPGALPGTACCHAGVLRLWRIRSVGRLVCPDVREAACSGGRPSVTSSGPRGGRCALPVALMHCLCPPRATFCNRAPVLRPVAAAPVAAAGCGSAGRGRGGAGGRGQQRASRARSGRRRRRWLPSSARVCAAG
jgi:hypothetical protein